MLFNNLKIRTKLLAGFGVVLVLVAILGIISYLELKKTDDTYTNLIDNVTSRSQSMTDIGWSFARYRRIVATAILRVGDKASLDTLREQYEHEKADIQRQFDIFDNATAADITLTNADRTDIKGVSDKIEDLLVDEYEVLMEKVFSYAYANDYENAFAEIENAQDIATTLDNEISDFIQNAKDNTTKMSDASTVSSKRSELVVMIVLFITIAMGLTIALLIANMITKGINSVTEAAGKISQGDFNVSVGSNGKDEIAMLSNSLLNLKVIIQNLSNDINKVANNFAVGELSDLSVNPASYNGEFKGIAESVNRTVGDLIDNCLYAIQIVSDIGNGNFNIDVRQFPGQRIVMTNSFQTVKDNLIRFNKDIVSIIDGAVEGDLDINVDTSLYEGDWNKMAVGINRLLTAIVKPIRETIEVLDQLSNGNLGVSVNGNYNGEFERMKSSLNNTLKMLSSYINEISSVLGSMSNQDLTVSITREYVGQFVEIQKSINNITDVFNRLIREMNSAAAQVAAGSKQIADSSMDLAQGTAEQASSVEQLNATIEDISSQTTNNAKNADHANRLANGAKETAEKGNKEMHSMLSAMSDINDSSASISKIIKVIDDIAFQTNLLALNAAVEAARAGEHGKGFAVVAEEVRSLAGRSQSAAKETSTLIENSVAKVSDGSKIANETAKALETIVSEISEIVGIISDVADASIHQSDAIGQINIGINQISEVTQNNSATSEEQASASQELSSQADLFRDMVSKFKL